MFCDKEQSKYRYFLYPKCIKVFKISKLYFLCCKVSQNPSFVEENKPFNLETNTINFALSVSCFVVTDKSTNEIMDKFILSVSTFSNLKFQ